MIAEALLAAALQQPVEVVRVTYDAWTVPGAAVGALAMTEPLLMPARTDPPELRPGVRYVIYSEPEAGRLGGVALYPGSGILRGSTRRDGLVTATDIAAHVSGERPLTVVPGTVDDVEELAYREHLHRPYHGVFHTGLIALPMLLFIWLVFGTRPAGPRARRIGLVLAAYPAAGFVSSLLPWWKVRWSAAAAVLAVVLATALVAVLGVLAARLLRTPREVGIALVTAAFFAGDLLTGGYLQETGIASYSAVAAGRFHGLGNAGFAILATASVIACAAAARRYGRIAWLGLVPVLAVVAAPPFGADFGGAVTLTAVLVAALATRTRPVLVALGAVAGLVVAGVVAWLDYRRATPTHLGKFVDEVLHGGWWDTVSRKGRAALSSLATWYPLLAVGGAVTVRRLRSPLPALPFVVLWVLGSAVNDSGVVVAAAGLAVAGPLLVSYDA